jgi:N-hydroxyarylamine O-acetyltransferase
LDTRAYLARIGLAGPPATLEELQVAHLLSVPFENLDIAAGVPITMDLDAIFDKVVRRRRGGFCYELNGLFARLLEELGYSVTLYSARVVDDEDAQGQEFDHLVLRVELDEPWLVDVGFGDTFREPMPLQPDSEFLDSLGRTYRLEVNGEVWELNEQRTQYRFTLAPRAFAEFEPMCRWQQTESPYFTGHRFCTIATADGRRTLMDDRLIVHSGAERTEREIDEAEVPGLLAGLFGIQDPDLVSVRPPS